MINRTSEDFSRLITNKSITIGFDGKTRTIKKEDPAYDKLLQAIRNEQWNDIEKHLSPDVAINAMSDGEMRIEDGNVVIKGLDGEFLVPSGLNTTILHYMDKGLPFKPLIKFAINLHQNPSYNSVLQLFSFLEHNKFTITEDGKFIAYKGVTKNFLDCHTRTIDNSVGMVVSMERDQVTEDPQLTCSRGLHVANFEYSKVYYGSGSQNIHLFVEVNPKDVVSVPVDYNNAKMRVCEYRVLGVCKGEFKDEIYTSGDDGAPRIEVQSEEEDSIY